MALAWLPDGDWKAAETGLQARAASGDCLAAAALARLAVAQGRFAEAAQHLQKAVAESRLSGSDRAWVLMTSAWLALEDARPLQALDDLKAAGQDLPDDMAAWAMLDALMAEAFLRIGARAEAGAAASRALARAATAGELAASSRALRVQAELAAGRGEVDQADRDLRAAVDDAERAHDAYELGQSLMNLGLFLGRQPGGRGEDSARQALSLARTWFGSIGAATKLREVDLYLERVHGKSRR